MVAAVKAAAALEGQAAGLRQEAGAAAAGAGMPVLSGRLAAVAVVALPTCQSPSFPHATSFRRIYSGPHTIKSTTKTQSDPPAGEADARDTWRKDENVAESDRAFHCKGGATKPGRCLKSHSLQLHTTCMCGHQLPEATELNERPWWSHLKQTHCPHRHLHPGLVDRDQIKLVMHAHQASSRLGIFFR